MRSARRGAAFTPRSQAQEDAKAAHRRSMVNGSMKKLMCVPFVVSQFDATCDLILKCYRAFDTPVHACRDKNWAARKTAVEALVSL